METSILFPSDPDSLHESGKNSLHPFSLYNSDTHRKRPLAVIVAVSDNGAIGRDGDLLRHIPADLKRFKMLTMGHPVIMGRRTWESLPKGALPGRRNIVITSSSTFSAPGAESASSLEEAIAMCQINPVPFIIGGGQLYASALPYATELHVTRIFDSSPDADTFFPEINMDEWRLSEESERFNDGKNPEFCFRTYKRISE